MLLTATLCMAMSVVTPTSSKEDSTIVPFTDTPTAKARWVLIYIHFQIYSKAYKTFTTKDTLVSISDSIRFVSKPIYILYCYTT